MGMLYDGHASEDSVWGARDRTPAEVAKDQAFMAWRETPEGVAQRRQDARITKNYALKDKCSSWASLRHPLEINRGVDLHFPSLVVSELVSLVGADPLETATTVSDLMSVLANYSRRTKMTKAECLAWFPGQATVVCNLEEFSELITSLRQDGW